MSYRQKNFEGIILMIEKYEYKFKKEMTIQILAHYICEAFKISNKTAIDYIKELVEMKYIYLNGSFVKRL